MNAHYFKTTVSAILIFLASLATGGVILNFVKEQNYFEIPWATGAYFILFGVILGLLYALSVGAWNNTDQYIFVGLPIAAGMFFNLTTFGLTHAIAFSVVCYGLICYYIFSATQLMALMIKFYPTFVLRTSIRITFIIFSIMSGYMVFLNYTVQHNDINLGKEIGRIAEEQVQENGLGLFDTIKNFNIPVESIITNNVNDFIQPYKHFVAPLMGVIVFSYFHILSWIVYIIYSMLLQPLFWLMQKLGVYRVELIDTKKEVLSF